MDCMTHIWSPTLFPRGIITFQGVLTKFNFLTKFPHLEKNCWFYEIPKIYAPKHFSLVGEGQTFRDRYEKPNIYSKNSSRCQVIFTGLSKNDFGIILQTLTHPYIHVINCKLCKLGNGDTPCDAPITLDAPHDGGPFGKHVAMWLFHLIFVLFIWGYIGL